MNRRQILTTTGVVASLGLCAGIVVGAPGCTTPAAEFIIADLGLAPDPGCEQCDRQAAMTIATSRALPPTPTPLVAADRLTLRLAIARQIEALIDQLDAMDGDADLEDGGDAEPSLGWSATMAISAADDCEDTSSEWATPRQS